MRGRIPIRSKNFPHDGVSDSGRSGSSPPGRAARTTRLPHSASRRAAVAAAGPPPTTSTSHAGSCAGMEPADYNSRMLRRCALVGLGALAGRIPRWLLATRSGRVTSHSPTCCCAGWPPRRSSPGWSRSAAAACRWCSAGRPSPMWLLAAVLHGPALANDLDGFATPSLPEAAVGAHAGVAVGDGARPGAARALWLRATSAGLTTCAVAAVVARVPARPRSAASGLGFLPRPPPLR